MALNIPQKDTSINKINGLIYGLLYDQKRYEDCICHVQPELYQHHAKEFINHDIATVCLFPIDIVYKYVQCEETRSKIELLHALGVIKTKYETPFDAHKTFLLTKTYFIESK